MIKSLKSAVLTGFFAALVVGGAVFVWQSPGSTVSEPAVAGGPATYRRLNQGEYTRTIEYIFGSGLTIPGRFEPSFRNAGLLAIGDGELSVTSAGVEQHELRAREVAAQVLAEERRDGVMPCAPDSADVFDQSCAEQFIGKYGRLLIRRDLSEADRNATLELVRAGTEQSGDFYQGLQLGLVRFLMSPNFLFRMEHSEPDPYRAGEYRLDAFSLAMRLSFLLWGAAPDEELLDAAESGALHQQEVLEQQVDRMMASPRFEAGVRAFFSDMYAYEVFDGLRKDPNIFPKFSSRLAAEAREQQLRTIVDLLVDNRGDYRDLFTTRDTFMTRSLASVYQVPVSAEAAGGEWMPYTFAEEDRRAGLLSLVGFLMADETHEGISSPTIRGKVVRELFMCHEVPDPPPDVDFSDFQDPASALRTARERLAHHNEHPACAGCHAITDPIGLSLENYTGIGEFRTHENGALIDASGELEGSTYDNLIELADVLRESPSIPQCVVQRVYEYGVGRPVAAGDYDWLDYRVQRFAEGGHVFTDLLRGVATSGAFRAVSPTVAMNQASANQPLQ